MQGLRDAQNVNMPGPCSMVICSPSASSSCAQGAWSRLCSTVVHALAAGRHTRPRITCLRSANDAQLLTSSPLRSIE